MSVDVIDTEFTAHESALAVRDTATAFAPLPTVSAADAREAMRRYQEICEAVLTADDYQEFRERGKSKRFKKKSAVKKLQTFWSVSVAVREMVRDDLGGEGHFGFRCIATASMPSGRTVEASGGCSTFEERFDLKPYDDESEARYAERCKKARARSYHDVMSTAETRATNRAVMNCIGVGGGEVTADEISRSSKDALPARQEKRDEGPSPTDLMLERAVKLRLIPDYSRDQQMIAIKNYATKAGIEFRVGPMNAHMDALQATRNATKVEDDNRPSPHYDAMHRKAMALFGRLGYDEAARHDTYESICGDGIRSWRSVVAAGKAGELLDRLDALTTCL